ncbi:MAG: a-factor receptor [Pleopsidium flavum]|nr:MAG: a-factor receptor [Pleopsidium flavum]
MASSSFGLSPAAIAVPTLSFITLVLCLPPFVWHVKNRNIAASSLVFWIFLDNFFNFINALIWPTDDIASWWNGAGLCDVEVKLMAAATVGLTGSMACIMRNLAQVMDTDRTVLEPSRARRRKEGALNVLFCFGCPVYLMVIHYLVQPNRYYIFAIAGCTTSYDNSWPSIALVFIWPPILCVLAAYYGALVILRLHRYRKEFADILSASGSNLNKSRFMRLFIMSLALIVIFLPVQTYVFYRNLSFPRIPYSWDAVHGAEWWQIIMIPTGGVVVFDRWIQIGCGFLVFFFFGLGKDAMKMYRAWLLKMGFGRIFPSLKGQYETQRTPSTGNRFGSVSSRAKLVFSWWQSRRDSSSAFRQDRHDSITTEVLTPSPSDPKKTFLHLSSDSKPNHSPPHSNMCEKPLPPCPVDPKPWRPFVFRRDDRLDSELHAPSRSIFAPDLESQIQPQGSYWMFGARTGISG